MVIILDGNSEHALRRICLLGGKIRFVTALDLIECLRQYNMTCITEILLLLLLLSACIRKIGLLGGKLRFVTALDLIKCLKQFKLQ